MMSSFINNASLNAGHINQNQAGYEPSGEHTANGGNGANEDSFGMNTSINRG